jgi:hypothetical protein
MFGFELLLVSSRIVLNMQNGGLGRNPRPAQATIKVHGRFLQSGDSADLEYETETQLNSNS